MSKVKVALIGVGNCASALLQGLQFYGKTPNAQGLRNPNLGGLTPKDIEVVAAFDVDENKVGQDLAQAIFVAPNNTPKAIDVPKTGVVVAKGPLLDGVGKSTKILIQISKTPDANVAQVLKDAGAEVVINLLPSGAIQASLFYAQQALDAKCAFINAAPIFIASDAAWAKKFQEAKLPLIGDDLVDQVGSTALHKTLLTLLSQSGVHINETYQLDVGGGNESVDTLDRTKAAKRKIKTEAVAAALPYKTEIVAGSTDFVDFLQNKRDSYFFISGVYFNNSPLRIDLKFSTVDAPNAGSVLFDVIRAAKFALNKKVVGSVEAVCAYGFKHPPKLVALEEAEDAFTRFIATNS
jgi:myo-inositol-1-phosphate synthase